MNRYSRSALGVPELGAVPDLNRFMASNPNLQRASVTDKKSKKKKFASSKRVDSMIRSNSLNIRAPTKEGMNSFSPLVSSPPVPLNTSQQTEMGAYNEATKSLSSKCSGGSGGSGAMGGLQIDITSSMELKPKQSIGDGFQSPKQQLKKCGTSSVDLRTPSNIHNSTAAEIDALLEDTATDNGYPLKRLDFLGKGSCSYVYRTIMLDKLAVCAEKVVIVNDMRKRVQMLRELEILRRALKVETKKYHVRKSQVLKESLAERKKAPQDNREEGSFPLETSVASIIPDAGKITDGSAHVLGLLGVVPNPLDGTLSICLEYMNGGSLQDLVDKGGCQEEGVIKGIALQLVSGLEFLHGMRVLHRDIKPSNCLINSKGHLKLADFGLARVLEAGASYADSFLGTLEYMAPERLDGSKYTFASDVWSLGLTLYAVALGAYPYADVEVPISASLEATRIDEGKENKRQPRSEVPKKNKPRPDYWYLMYAIKEMPVPLPKSPPFGNHFVEFIQSMCHKEGKDRLTAPKLLEHEFLRGANVPTTQQLRDPFRKDDEEEGEDARMKSNNNNEDAAVNPDRFLVLMSINGETLERDDPTRGELRNLELMSAAEAADLAAAWGAYATDSFVKALALDEKLNAVTNFETPAEKELAKGLLKFQKQRNGDRGTTDSFLGLLNAESVSASKISSLAREVGCNEGILRTAFHATVGDMRLAAMHAVAREGKKVDIDKQTMHIKQNKTALLLKNLVNTDLSEPESESESDKEEEEEKKKEEMDTDEENMMFSDNDAVSTTESEDDSSDEEDFERQRYELGRKIFMEMQAKSATVDGASVGVSLPPI